ncbi:hypothetical protein PAXRUDRAFT_778380 [Paxillus rubicundulus Ve08.2h10]|uniref:Uncharacterized protein n=1 Tax=Paxillus rubicundulus Ve08.2h10 TaxID=930991 RepID=A0A0D0DH35_9AGAM|nr:hypothetical protein PAXRUDRAFT_778380 [Paxillus rubicundulus Ve08.2h10]
MSATLPPPMLSNVCHTMHIKTASSYVINLGIDCPNITWEVRHMTAAKSDFALLCFLLPKCNGGEGEQDSFKNLWYLLMTLVN